LSKAIKLDVVFYGSAGFHLSETPLSKDQKIFEDKKRGGMRVKATLDDTAQLRWWLLGFSDQVEVLGPKALRDEFIEVTKKMVSIYK
jgi:predicted DNA-binding transcriptional regulator YafY